MARHSAAGRPARPRRPNRFDRPPEPHDWRWVVGGIGRTLISLGVLLFAFVAYQLWGTGIQTARAQNRLEQSFEALLAAGPPVTSPPTSGPAPDTTSNPTPTTITPVDPTGTTAPLVTAPVVSPIPAVAPARGEPLARLEITSIGLGDVIVVEGVRPDDLKTGPGHFPETPLPGQLGNSAIAGHRTTYGEPFLDIDLIPIGADVVLTTPWGRYVYVVESTNIVGADDYALVIPTIDPNRATLTLVSCHPKYSAKQRYIVTAVLAADRSDPIAFSGPVPTPTTTLPPPTTTLPITTAPSTTLSAPVSPDTTSSPATAPPTSASVAPVPTSVAPAAPDDVSSEDVFASQWFSDDEAFVPAALWGFRLMIVAFLATAISRITRRNVVGGLIGIAPFVVCLYFFFEDLSRLLPANL